MTQLCGECPSVCTIHQVKTKSKRVKTIYDCQADNEDELTFAEGEVIMVTGEEDQEWWVSRDAISCFTSQCCDENGSQSPRD